MRAGDLIERARDYDRDFHRRSSPPLVLLRRLSRIEQAVAADLAGEYPEALATTNTIANADLTTALAGTGVLSVPAYITILDPMYGVLTSSAGPGEVRVHQIARSQQYKEGAPFPSVALSDAELHMTDLRRVGNTEHGWEEVDSLRYDYVPLPSDLANLDSTLTVPDGLRGYLEASLAQWMARRLNKHDAARSIGEDVSIGMSSFLNTVALQNRGSTWHVLDEAR